MFINYNGSIHPSSDHLLSFNNRAFRYGDGLFESIRVANKKVLFLNDHWERILYGASILKMNLPEQFTVHFLNDSILQLCEQNKMQTARIRLQIFRNEGGFYEPSVHDTSFVIEATQADNNAYTLNTEIIRADVFTEVTKGKNPLSNFKTCSSLIYVMAGIYCKENNLQECFLTNTDGNITESLSSNVFWVKDNIIYTPPVSEGCVNGIMRHQLLEILKKEKRNAIEKILIPDELLNADEILLTNASRGIRWVGSFREKKFQPKLAAELLLLLNKKLEQEK